VPVLFCAFFLLQCSPWTSQCDRHSCEQSCMRLAIKCLQHLAPRVLPQGAPADTPLHGDHKRQEVVNLEWTCMAARMDGKSGRS